MNINEDKFANKSAEEIVNDVLLQHKNNTQDALGYIKNIANTDGLVLPEETKKELKKAEDMLKNKLEEDISLPNWWPFSKKYDIEVSCLPPFKKEPVKITVNQAKGFDDPKVLEVYKKVRNKHPKSPIYLRNPELGRKVFYENSIHDFKVEAIYASESRKETLEAGTLEIAMQMAEKLWKTNKFDQVLVFKKDKPVCELNKQSNGWIVHDKKSKNNIKPNTNDTEDNNWNSEHPIKQLTNDFFNDQTTQEVGSALLSSATGIAPHFLTPVTRSLTNLLLNRLNRTKGESCELKEDEFVEPEIFNKKDMLNSRNEYAYDLDKRLIYELHEINPAYDDTRKPSWLLPKEYWKQAGGADVTLPSKFWFYADKPQTDSGPKETIAYKTGKLRNYLVDKQKLLTMKDWVDLVYTNPEYLKCLRKLIFNKGRLFMDIETFEQAINDEWHRLGSIQQHDGIYVLTKDKGLEFRQLDAESGEWMITPAEQLSFVIYPDDYDTDILDEIIEAVFKTISEKTGKSIEELRSAYKEEAKDASKYKTARDINGKDSWIPEDLYTTFSAATTGGTVPNLTNGEYPDNAPITLVLDSITYPTDENGNKVLPRDWSEIDTPEKLEEYKNKYNISDDNALVKLNYKVPVEYLGEKKDGSPRYKYTIISNNPYIITVGAFKALINDPINHKTKTEFDEKYGVDNFFALIKKDFIVKEYLDNQFYDWKDEYNDIYKLDRFDHMTQARIYDDFKKHMHSTLVSQGKPLSPAYVTETYYLPKIAENNKNIPIMQGITKVLNNLKAKHPDLAKDAITKLSNFLEKIVDVKTSKITDKDALLHFYNTELAGYEQLTNGLPSTLVNTIAGLYSDLNKKDLDKAKDFISQVNDIINANMYKDDILGITTLNNKEKVVKELNDLVLKNREIETQIPNTQDKELNRDYRKKYRFMVSSLKQCLLETVKSIDNKEEQRKARNAINNIEKTLNIILDGSAYDHLGKELSFADQNKYLKEYAHKFYGINLDDDDELILNKIINIVKNVPLQKKGFGGKPEDAIASQVNDIKKQYQSDKMLDNPVIRSKIGKNVDELFGQAALAKILKDIDK